jgi:diadenosine tetraphosphate (Ap4A) HIT family hydrolase
MNAKCPFCSVSQERVLIANKHCIAFADSFPISQGHTLIVPIRHVASVYELSEEERSHIWLLVEQVRSHLANTLHPDGFNIGLNDGPAAGQTIGHAHVHVIPRYKGDVVDPRGGIRWIMPEKAKYWSDSQ